MRFLFCKERNYSIQFVKPLISFFNNDIVAFSLTMHMRILSYLIGSRICPQNLFDNIRASTVAQKITIYFTIPTFYKHLTL